MSISRYNNIHMTGLQRNEAGMVSFMITMIMLIVISLVVIGFTQVANRNRREVLDRQLSSQAFYAAESGVNDAITQIRADVALGNSPQRQTSCSGGNYNATTLNPDPLVAYTCVLVNPVAPDITASASTQASFVVPIVPSDQNGNNQNPANLTFTWSVANGASTNRADCQLGGVFASNTDPTNLCGYALLRVDLLQYSPAAPFWSPTGMNANTATFYMQPVSSNSANYNFTNFSGPKANIVRANCNNATGTCTGTLSISGAARSQYYYARITTLYHDTDNLVIDGQATNGTSLWFSEAQAVVDVTGKAQDTLRRVQVRVPLQDFGDSGLPEGSVNSSASVCKHFVAYDGSFDDSCN